MLIRVELSSPATLALDAFIRQSIVLELRRPNARSKKLINNMPGRLEVNKTPHL